MPIIYEILGFPHDDDSEYTNDLRKQSYCPFTGTVCDGGGNRYQSQIDLSSPEHKDLADYFDGLDVVQSGVCSIQIKPDENPWIVCPRRLFYLGEYATQEIFDSYTQHHLIELCDFEENETIGTWWEVKIQYTEKLSNGNSMNFNYVFDYVLMPLKRVSIKQASIESNLSEKELLKLVKEGGYHLSSTDNEIFIDDFPSGEPTIVEVMTSSTTGGNKKKRTQIPQAFEDFFINNGKHTAPGVNYRQVWARMVSQLIVKSQAAAAWGGRTIWVLQDSLAKYISNSTALNLEHFERDSLSEVNILSYSYESKKSPKCDKGKTLPLSNSTLYSGPIRPLGSVDSPSFQDIVLAAVCPPKSKLLVALLKKGILNRFKYSRLSN